MLICCLVFAGVQAQKITRDYNNVSLSEALRQLNEETEEYTISFLYNELEDFRITTSVHRKSVPDAIHQMIGFYPIRMTVEPGIANPSQQEIIVECPQKTANRYKGTIIDEQGQPVAYANIALLSPQDSTLITGGVSNESGLFVIPCEQKPVLARISFVGYKTIYKQCNTKEIGTIRMQPETLTLKGVTVKAYYRSGFHIFKTSGSLNLRLSRQFLKDKSLSVALLARDILRTDYVKGTEYNGIGYRVDVETYRDRRRIGIDVSWKFNATRSRYKGSHAGQSERNRL